MSFFTDSTPVTAFASVTALSTSAFDFAVPPSVTTPLSVSTWILVALTVLSLANSALILVVIIASLMVLCSFFGVAESRDIVSFGIVSALKAGADNAYAAAMHAAIRLGFMVAPLEGVSGRYAVINRKSRRECRRLRAFTACCRCENWTGCAHEWFLPRCRNCVAVCRQA